MPEHAFVNGNDEQYRPVLAVGDQRGSGSAARKGRGCWCAAEPTRETVFG
jgi:hypothetical protein